MALECLMYQNIGLMSCFKDTNYPFWGPFIMTISGYQTYHWVPVIQAVKLRHRYDTFNLHFLIHTPSIQYDTPFCLVSVEIIVKLGKDIRL